MILSSNSQTRNDVRDRFFLTLHTLMSYGLELNEIASIQHATYLKSPVC